MSSKVDTMRAANGDHIAALGIAANFFDRSIETQVFKRGMDAHNHPGFYRQLGKDPEFLTACALELLSERFNLNVVK